MEARSRLYQHRSSQVNTITTNLHQFTSNIFSSVQLFSVSFEASLILLNLRAIFVVQTLTQAGAKGCTPAQDFA